MGSALRLVVPRLAPGARQRAWRVLRDDIEQTEQALSRFRAESELSALNARAGDGAWHRVGHRLWTCLAACERASRLTGGRFDARTVRPLEELGERAGVALPETVSTQRGTWLERDPRTRSVRLWEPADSGGIGKGLALRWAAEALRRIDVTDFLIEAGGDIVISGRPSDGGPWRIGIEDPDGRPGSTATVVSLARGAIVTSSTAVRRWIDPSGRAVHHLLDPRTWRPASTGLTSVTVAGTDAAWSEVWSKALFLAGTPHIAGEAGRRRIAAWWTEEGGAAGMTPLARQMTAWQRPGNAHRELTAWWGDRQRASSTRRRKRAS